MSATILVVEDNPITRKMFRFTLESEGHEVLEAGSGQEALAALGEQPAQLVLQDYVLPDMGGLELVAALRRRPGYARVPIIVATGMASQIDEMRGRAGPDTTIVAKPVEPSHLAEMVRVRLSGGPVEAGRGRRLLVVDDDAMNRKLARLRLEDAGFEVELAAGGREALEQARRRPPDAVLSDVLMPGVDGFLLCRSLREDEALRRVPVVLVSASYVDAADQELARRMGANALVPRTSDLGDALAALLQALDQPAPAPVAEAAEAAATLHAERVRAQVERQLERHAALAKIAAIQAAALSVVRGLAEGLSRPEEIGRVLADVLVHCLDAAGLSTGALYAIDAMGELRLQAHAGLSSEGRRAAATLFGRGDLAREVLASGIPRASLGDELPARFGGRSALLVPLVVTEERLGLLLLASQSEEMTAEHWLGFARALAFQFGQALAIGRSLSRRAATEARYRGLIEQAHDSMLILDEGYRVLDANRQTERLLGRSRSDLLGHSYLDFVVPEEREHARRSREELLQNGTLRVSGRLLLGPAGRRVSVDVSSAVVRFDQETTLLFILRDMTEAEAANARLRDAQQRLAHVVSSSPAVLYRLSVEGRSLRPAWVSSNIEDVIGFAPPAAAAAEWYTEHVHPDDRSRVAGHVERLLETGRTEREYRFRRRDGRYVWIRDEQRLLRDGSGRPAEVVGAWWIIEDRKRAEMRLEESERQYRLLFDANPHPMWVYDQESLRFLAVNDAAVRHYGWTRDEFLRMTIEDIRPPEDLPALRERLREIGGEPPGEPRVWRHRLKDGSLRQVRVLSSAIRFGDRRATLVLANDVTEHLALEQQLRQAQKMEAIGQLAGGVAHDFNNLLGVILGTVSLLERNLAPEAPERKRLTEVRKAAEHAAGLTRQLLAFSRRQMLDPKVLDTNECIAEAETLLRRLIGEDIRLVVALGPDVGRVRADAGRIQQVVLNLVVNARDAMPAGGRLVIETSNAELDAAYARLHPDVKPGRYVLVAVSDTGHGMDAETLAHVFEPFFTTKEPGKGTGLGLATVFGIVGQSGGHVAVYSEVGHGTTFRVYLPRVDDLSVEEADRGGGAAPGGTEAILVVEDSEPLRTIAEEILSGAGYTVWTAAAPSAALEMLAARDQGPDLLLTDVVMPGMSGRELADRLRKAYPRLRVVFMSGYADTVGGRLAEPGETLEFIGKPFTLDALLRKVRSVLDAA